MNIRIASKPHVGKSVFLSAVVWFLGSLSQTLQASECSNPVAKAISIQGQVEVMSEGASTWTPVRQHDELCPGDRLRVGADSRAGLNLSDDTLLRLAENSTIRISAPLESGSAWLDLLEGIAHFISRVRHSFQVNTPYVNASIEGTEFTVESGSDRATITVLEGRVKADNAYGEVVVGGGQKALALRDSPPQIEKSVDPLDAVKWTLYYPSVKEVVAKKASAASLKSYQAYQRGDIAGALSALAENSDSNMPPDQLVYRASLHLRIGKVDVARRELDQALRLKPEHADALALLSIIATVHNERQKSLELAQRAVKANPRGLSPLLALSYARQARFQLPEAMEAARQATEAAPESALAWSRLAQLHLMFRQLDEGTDAAWRAARIAPDLPESMACLGFAHLLQPSLSIARQAFEQAVNHDQAAPLPRLGLGLLKIREGDLTEGRRQLEIAANLDPGNALIRSYLGKAYYEEKRNEQASTQLALSKQFDERDPTPWFYDAILLQSENRPIEALNELQASIDLNDNRAVYRSRFLLDQDEAARNASQARVYQDLGFEQLARNEAYKSLQTSAHNHSAHRLLSDSYSGQPRLEKARFSELLQSQLLQPLNSNPIQPQLASSKLGILDGAGPSSSGFSEYTPLFTRNGVDLQFNAIGGSNDTVGDDLILSGLGERMAFSFGQFHYETDGWRENNDLTQDIYDAFLQLSITPSTSLQFEYRRQDAESGDLFFRFNPEDFTTGERNDLEHRVGRIGVHHQFESNGHLIASAIDQDLLKTTVRSQTDLIPLFPTPYGEYPGTLDSKDTEIRDSNSRTLELQFIQPVRGHVYTLGGGNFHEDFTLTLLAEQILRIPLPEAPFLFELPILLPQTPDEHIDTRFQNIYLYSLLALPANVNLTLGLSHEDFEESFYDSKLTNSKFGLTWEAQENLTFRAAYIENLARPLHMEQTIEPTQVAGFIQLFDAVAGSEIEQFGFGVDAALNRALSVGAEFNRRDIQEPVFVLGGDVNFEDVDEESSRLYLHWTATNRLGINLAYEKETFNQQRSSPEDLTTKLIPVGLTHHWRSGVFLQTKGTYVDQNISRSGIREQDSFWNVDAVIGYRFPKRYGKAELIVKNILDEEFNYYDLSFHTGDFLTPRFQPERQVYARFSINF
jgi:lipoprotein NlpI